MSEDVQNRWTSRKFWTMMFWQAVFTWMARDGIIPPDIYEGLTWVTVGGYIAANVVREVAIVRNSR